MARNKLAGKSTGKSDSAKYFASNPEARKKKIAYQKAYNARPDQKTYRAELNKANRDGGTYGKMTKLGKDRSHTKSGKIVMEDRSTNRKRNGKDKKSTKR